MNGMNLYQGQLTGTVTNGVADVVISRVADHACHCMECESLDEIDAKEVELARRFLKGEIDYSAFRVGHIELSATMTPKESAIHKHFDTGACSLRDSIEILCADFSEGDVETLYHSVPAGEATNEPMTMREFRIGLDCLIFGYEIRMRTVHQWTITRLGAGS